MVVVGARAVPGLVGSPPIFFFLCVSPFGAFQINLRAGYGKSRDERGSPRAFQRNDDWYGASTIGAEIWVYSAPRHPNLVHDKGMREHVVA